MAVNTRTQAAPKTQSATASTAATTAPTPTAAPTVEGDASELEPEPKVIYRLCLRRLERFFYVPHNRLYIRHENNDKSRPVVAYEFDEAGAREALNLKDPQGLPVFTPYKRSLSDPSRRPTQAEPRRREPAGELDTAVRRWMANGDGRGVDLGAEDDDPELAARLQAADALEDGAVTGAGDEFDSAESRVSI